MSEWLQITVEGASSNWKRHGVDDNYNCFDMTDLACWIVAYPPDVTILLALNNSTRNGVRFARTT